MILQDSLFIKHLCPVNSTKGSSLHISHCSFISCFSEKGAGAIYWGSSGSWIFLDNVVGKYCECLSGRNFAILGYEIVSISISSFCLCEKGGHVITSGKNVLVLNSNFSKCSAGQESLLMYGNQSEVRLSHFDSCYASNYVILSFISTLNRGSYIDVSNCTSASTTNFGVLRNDAYLFLYNSNFVDNKGHLMFCCGVNGISVDLLNCYVSGLNSCNGKLNSKFDQNWKSKKNDIPIIIADGYRRMSHNNIRRGPGLIFLFIPMSAHLSFSFSLFPSPLPLSPSSLPLCPSPLPFPQW